MTQKLLEVTEPQQVQSGLWPAAHPRDVPLWEDGRNVFFFEGGVQKMPKWESDVAFGVNHPPRGAHAHQEESGDKYLFTGDKNELNQINLTANGFGTGGSGYTGNDKTQWSFESYGNWVIASNGVDPVQIDKLDGNGFSSLAGTTFDSAEVVLERDSFLLAINTTSANNPAGQNFVHWSDADDPENWGAASTNLAGNLNIREMDGGIIAALKVGSEIALIGTDQLMRLRFTGEPFIFGYEPSLVGIGAVSKNAAVEQNGQIYGMSKYGFWLSDMRQFRYIGQQAIWQFVLDNMDFSNIEKVCCDLDSDYKIVTWWLPGKASGEIDFGVGFHVDSQAWTIFDFARSAVVPNNGVLENPWRIRSDGLAFEHNLENSPFGPEAWVRSKPMELGSTRFWKYIDVLQVEMHRLNMEPEIRLGWKANLFDSTNWQSWHKVTEEFSDFFERFSGRFVQLEVRSLAIDGEFLLTGFLFYGTQAGRQF